MRRCAKRVATRRISWIDQRMRAGSRESAGVSFARRAACLPGGGCGHHGESEHHQRDMTVPTVPGAGFTVVKADAGRRFRHDYGGRDQVHATERLQRPYDRCKRPVGQELRYRGLDPLQAFPCVPGHEQQLMEHEVLGRMDKIRL